MVDPDFPWEERKHQWGWRQPIIRPNSQKLPEENWTERRGGAFKIWLCRTATATWTGPLISQRNRVILCENMNWPTFYQQISRVWLLGAVIVGFSPRGEGFGGRGRGGGRGGRGGFGDRGGRGGGRGGFGGRGLLTKHFTKLGFAFLLPEHITRTFKAGRKLVWYRNLTWF